MLVSRLVVMSVAFVVVSATGASALAQIYSYTMPDGSIAYTDSLAQLPAERRAFYNRKNLDENARSDRIQRNQSPNERRAATIEAQRAKMTKEKRFEQRRQQRKAALRLAVQEAERTTRREAEEIAYWQEKKQQAVEHYQQAYREHRAAYDAWEAIAIKAQFALFPGEAARRDALEKRLPELNEKVRKAKLYITTILPEEARKAGVPPGYLR